jgi:hypothetical protein
MPKAPAIVASGLSPVKCSPNNAVLLQIIRPYYLNQKYTVFPLLAKGNRTWRGLTAHPPASV